MASIELHLESSKGEKIILKNPFNKIKTELKEKQWFFAISSGGLEIHFLFEDKKNFQNFLNNLKNDFLQLRRQDLYPEFFKVKIYRKENNLIEGEYSYLEFLSHGEKPAFFMAFNIKEKGFFEIYFYFDIKEELQKFINNLEKITTNKENLK